MDQAVCWCGEDADSECVECGEHFCRVHECDCPVEFETEAERQEYEAMCAEDEALEVAALDRMLLL